jgi:hypothetical protein
LDSKYQKVILLINKTILGIIECVQQHTNDLVSAIYQPYN